MSPGLAMIDEERERVPPIKKFQIYLDNIFKSGKLLTI